MELYMFCYTLVQGFWIFKEKRYFLLDIILVGFPSQRNESQLRSLRHVSKIQTVNRVIRCSPWRLASCGVQPMRTGVGGGEQRSGGGFRANCRQKATSFIIERDVKAAVWGLHSQQAKQDESRKDHIMFQMTEQRFIYQRRFSPSTERESNKREAGLAESVRWPMTNGRLLATLWLDALMSTFCAEFGLLLTVTFALYWPKWHVIFHILPIIARLLMSTPPPSSPHVPSPQCFGWVFVVSCASRKGRCEAELWTWMYAEFVQREQMTLALQPLRSYSRQWRFSGSIMLMWVNCWLCKAELQTALACSVRSDFIIPIRPLFCC